MNDRLFLEGRLQIETARHALEITGKDPATEKLLGNLLVCHELTRDNDPHSRLFANFGGEAGEHARQAVVDSLTEVQEAASIDPAVKIMSQDLLAKMISE